MVSALKLKMGAPSKMDAMVIFSLCSPALFLLLDIYSCFIDAKKNHGIKVCDVLTFQRPVLSF